jgi:hypothetical protein
MDHAGEIHNMLSEMISTIEEKEVSRILAWQRAPYNSCYWCSTNDEVRLVEDMYVCSVCSPSVDSQNNTVVRQLFPESLQSCEKCGFIGLNENDCSKRWFGDFLCTMCCEKQEEEAQRVIRTAWRNYVRKCMLFAKDEGHRLFGTCLFPHTQKNIEDGEKEIVVDEPMLGPDGITRVAITYPDGQEEIFETISGATTAFGHSLCGTTCDVCHHSDISVNSRGGWDRPTWVEPRSVLPTAVEFLHDRRCDSILDRDDSSQCISCIIEQDRSYARTLFGDIRDWGKTCVDCGYSSLLHSLRSGTHTVWKDDVDDLGVPCSRCPDCSEREIRSTAEALEDSPSMEWWRENGSTYEDEYELGEEPPENNSDKVKEVKDIVKDIGERIFDISDNITEGKYLELMNALQKLNNKVNAL